MPSTLVAYSDIKEQLRAYLIPYLESQGIHIVTGKNFKCINPAHDDSDPSCGIIPESNGKEFHCFGCKIVGDVFTAVNLIESRPLNGAGFIHENLKYLADTFGVELPIEKPTPEQIYEMDMYRAYRDAAQLILFSKFSDRVESKLTDYGWSKQTRLNLGVGSVSSYEDFISCMKKQNGWSDSFLKEVDLHRKNMFNENSLIFTVKDENGNPVGFACRNLLYEEETKDYTEKHKVIIETISDIEEQTKAINNLKKPTKYVNSMEHSGGETSLRNWIYQKSKRLYGLHRARKYTPPLYVLEGYSDCVTAVNAGINNAAAIGSTSFTRDHLDLILGLGIKHVIFVLDADEAGEAGTERFVKLLEECVGGHIGLRVEIISMPTGTDDPDAFIRHYGVKAFRDLVRTDIFGWSLKRAVKEGEDPQALAERMVPLIVNDQSNFVRLRKAEQLAAATKLPFDVIWREISRLVDSELSQIIEEQSIIAQQTAKKLQINPAGAVTILQEAQSQIEQIASRKNGYNVTNTKRYIDEIREALQSNIEKMELKTNWPLFDAWVNGIPKQEAFVTIPGKMNQGKALTMSSLLKTPTSWMKMKDVKVGNLLASHDGKHSVVTGVYPQGVTKVYKVTFSDGRSVECSGDHLWKVSFIRQRKEGYGEKLHNGWKVFTTESIAAFCLNNNRKNFHNLVYVPLVSGDFGKSIPLPIDPWLLGVLLGDGGITTGTPTITSADRAIISRVEEEIKVFDLTIAKRGKYSYAISNIENKGKINKLSLVLQTLGLRGRNSHTKFIPIDYLEASKEVRLELLRGLMDTDGTAGKDKSTSYTSTSEQLAKDTQYLVWSLGGICSITPRVKSVVYKGERKLCPCFQLGIRMPNPDIIFTLERKKNRVQNRVRNPHLTIKNIERTADQETQCISVSHPSHLYITNDFIVTHNSSYLANLAWRLLEYNKQVMVLYHTVDDSMPTFLPRLWASKYEKEGFDSLVHGNNGKRIGWESNDFKYAGYHLHHTPGFEEVYHKAQMWTDEMIESERLVPDDLSTLPASLEVLEMRIKTLRQKFPERTLVVMGDNFHLYQLSGYRDGEEKVRQMSMFAKALANRYHCTILMTMELPKSALAPGVRPRVRNIKGSSGMSYDSSLNIGVYNDMKDFGPNVNLFHHIHDAVDPSTEDVGYKQPVIELVFDKSKINSFDGVIYYTLEPRSGRMEEIPKDGSENQTYFRDMAAKAHGHSNEPQAQIGSNAPYKSL